MVPRTSRRTCGRACIHGVTIRTHLLPANPICFPRIMANLAFHQAMLECEGWNGVPRAREPQSAVRPFCRGNESIGIDAVSEQPHGCRLLPWMKAQVPISPIPDSVEEGNGFLDVPQEPYSCT